MQQRVQAKHTEINGLSFDSKLEAEFYAQLKRIKGIKVNRQYSLIVKQPTERFKAVYWKVDFQVILPDHSDLFIEVKGLWDSEFIRLIKYLEWFSPSDYLRLFIATPEIPPKLDKEILTRTRSLPSILTTIKQLAAKQLAERM